MQLPQDIMSHIADFMTDDIQAVDPRCYRASRRLQSAWRGWAVRFQKWRCKICGKRAFLGIKLVAHSGRVYARIAFGGIGFGIVHLRNGCEQMWRIPVPCPQCHTCRIGRHYARLLYEQQQQQMFRLYMQQRRSLYGTPGAGLQYLHHLFHKN